MTKELFPEQDTLDQYISKVENRKELDKPTYLRRVQTAVELFSRRLIARLAQRRITMAYEKKQTPNKSKGLQFNVSTPTEYEKNGEKQTYWTNIGRGFEGEKGIMVHLNALPVSGKMFLQVHTEKHTD